MPTSKLSPTPEMPPHLSPAALYVPIRPFLAVCARVRPVSLVVRALERVRRLVLENGPLRLRVRRQARLGETRRWLEVLHW